MFVPIKWYFTNKVSPGGKNVSPKLAKKGGASIIWGDKLTESTVCIQFLSPDSFPVSLLFQSLQVSLSLGFLVTQSLYLS